ncbi:MAG: group III truncated hemoglobin [Novosphingobium sp.]
MSEPHPLAVAARARKLERADALGIDAAFIDRLVETFYARIREDAVLGPIFAARISDWPPHLARMKQFWGAVLRESGGFTGNPMQKHVAIPGIEQAEFDRWLALFEATLQEIERDPEASALIAARARTIADSLLTGIRIHRDGVVPRRGPAATSGGT